MMGAMLSKRGFMFAILLGIWAAPGVAAERGISQSDSLPPHRASFVVLPYVYYTPETKIAFGGGAICSFRPAGAPSSTRPSSVRVAATYTQRNQIILALMPEMYFQKERYYVSAFYGYYRYPDKFWGIGPDTPGDAEENYLSNDLESNTNILRHMMPGLYVGIRYEYRYLNVTRTSPDGALRAGDIPGSLGGPASGLGVIINNDTRDHVYQPSSGFYNQCYAVFFGRGIGSDFTFSALSIDLRMYRAVFASHVLAFQTYGSFIRGDAPFQMLSKLGGSYQMRGYNLGRYRDKDMVTAQVEYRFPIWWRFGAVGFAGAGDVAGDVGGFRIDRLKFSVGSGIRFMFDTQEKINARLDVGFGSGDNAGIYAMVLEAF